MDAIIYAMRHLHATDVKFLESFRDPTAGRSGIVNALAVLSRADEIGGGRMDSLVSAHDIVERYRRDDALRGLVLGVAPIAGLLAQSARTLRQAEFAALAELARLDRAERERLAISADRFVRTVEGVTVSPEMRATLLARFGLFGIRLATVLIRSGMADPTALAHELARRSGLDELIGLIDGQFQARAAQLKARTALLAVETLLRDRPRAGTERLAASLERIQASAHEFRELQLLATHAHEWSGHRPGAEGRSGAADRRRGQRSGGSVGPAADCDRSRAACRRPGGAAPLAHAVGKPAHRPGHSRSV